MQDFRILRGSNNITLGYKPLEGNERGGRCVYCDNNIKPSEGVHIILPNQPRGVWMCKRHNNYDVSSYSSTNETKKGTERKDALYFGIELEVNPRGINVCHEGMAYLKTMGFKPTSDGTVGIEFKSPLYTSCNSFSKVCNAIEKLNTMDRQSYFDTSRRFTTKSANVGCHLNISTPFIRSNEGYAFIRNNKKMLFNNLEVYCRHMGEEWQKELFGRPIGGDWAKYNSVYDWDVDIHEVWINTEIKENNRLEFRVCKFINANQYITLVRIFSEVCKCIEENKTNTNGMKILQSFAEACKTFKA